MKLAQLAAAVLLLGGTMAAAPAPAPPPAPAPAGDQEPANLNEKNLLAPGAGVRRIATGMKFCEGPVWTDADGGYLVFSDIPASELKRWDAKDGLSIFRHPSNQANGNTRDRQERLISCEHESRRVTRSEADGRITVLADSLEGKKLNSPNDVVVKSDGTVWFTDPTYGIPRGEKSELNERLVFCIAADGGSDARDRAIGQVGPADFDQPNGLCFSPDETKLYVADSGTAHHIRVFDVKPRVEADAKARAGAIPWELENGREFCVIDKGVPDGIRCDERGNVWSSAGDGVQVFAPDGKLIARIAVPEAPANLCFGGESGRTLFLTARTSLYAIETNVRGAGRLK